MIPTISIGLPVHNGMPYLQEAVESLLAQSRTDFELIISDNASSDATQDLCAALAASDKRIIYQRSDRNKGAAWNFNRVFALSRGKYFRWAAHDDLCHKDLLLHCTEALEADKNMVLAYPRTATIDESGRPTRLAGHCIDVSNARAFRRFGSLICVNHACLPVFGLVRREALAKTRLIGSYVASDRVLLAELALHGRFHEVPIVLFYHREHPKRSTRAHNMQSRTAWFDPSKAGGVVFPNWRLLKEYTCSLRRSPLEPGERSICWFQFLPWIAANWRGMIEDVLAGVKRLLPSRVPPA